MLVVLAYVYSSTCLSPTFYNASGRKQCSIANLSMKLWSYPKEPWRCAVIGDNFKCCGVGVRECSNANPFQVRTHVPKEKTCRLTLRGMVTWSRAWIPYLGSVPLFDNLKSQVFVYPRFCATNHWCQPQASALSLNFVHLPVRSRWDYDDVRVLRLDIGNPSMGLIVLLIIYCDYQPNSLPTINHGRRLHWSSYPAYFKFLRFYLLLDSDE